MPIRSTIHPGRDVVVRVVEGRVDFQEELASLLELLDDDSLPRPLCVLDDRRGVKDLLEPDELRSLSERIRLASREVARIRLAVVVSGAAAYGMARMFQSLVEPVMPEVEIFRDLDAARRWLGAASPSPGEGAIDPD